jgi:MFS family permease
LLFPDGRLPSRRWRPAARFIVVAWGVSILNALTPAEGNPLSVPALGRPAGQLLLLVVNAAALAGLVISAAAPFLPFRRASYQQRQQLKWVAFTVTVSVLSVLVSLGLGQLFPGALVIGLLGLLGFLGVVVGLPVAVALAILRHRLYDIDRVINRTLVYGLLTALLAGIYAGMVLGLGQLFGGIGEQAPSWTVAAATLAVAALFQPARRRIQVVVDRRFNRRKYNAAKTVEAFSARPRDEVDLDTLSAELLAVVDQTVQPAKASLWLRPPTQVSPR